MNYYAERSRSNRNLGMILLVAAGAFLAWRTLRAPGGALRPGTFDVTSPENVVYRNIPHSQGGSFGSDLFDLVNYFSPSDAYTAAAHITDPTPGKGG